MQINSSNLDKTLGNNLSNHSFEDALSERDNNNLNSSVGTVPGQRLTQHNHTHYLSFGESDMDVKTMVIDDQQKLIPRLDLSAIDHQP